MKNDKFLSFFQNFVIVTFFLISLYFIVIRPLGPELSRIPGDLGDSRFNNYILEHDYRWINGKEDLLLTPSFFYPNIYTLAFSDNHFGSMLFYSFFRWLGLNRESAFQAWYIFSYLLNFCAAIIVLKKFELNHLSILFGSFFFTFGLPVLAQENHLQLSYRFCIPIACYSFWLFYQKPGIKQLAFTFFWLVWQFYLSIYLGYFLFLLLVVVALGLPFSQKESYITILRYWGKSFKNSWKLSKKRIKVFSLVALITLFFGLIALFLPYVMVTRLHGFFRSWADILLLLPKPASYLVADGSRIWRSLAFITNDISSYRDEHNLFIGLSVSILIFTGLVWRFQSKHRTFVYLFLAAAGVLILLTINIHGFSLYGALWYLPGANNIRAVSRIILVIMWPIAFFISFVVDSLSRHFAKARIGYVAGFLLFLLMFAESIFFDHRTFAKLEGESREQKLMDQIPAIHPDDPILFVWYSPNEFWYLDELDAMLVSQDLNWPVLNGYSGNFPGGYGPTTSCNQAIIRITEYLALNEITDPAIYDHLISRIVAIGPASCQ